MEVNLGDNLDFCISDFLFRLTYESFFFNWDFFDVGEAKEEKDLESFLEDIWLQIY